MTYWKRFTETDSPMCRAGYAMFVRDDIISDEDMSGYGPTKWVYTGEPVHITTLWDVIVEGWEKAPCEALTPSGRNRMYDGVSGEDIATLANPADIVESAGLWDDWDLVQWIWDLVLEPRGIVAVETEDGCLVFDEALIQRAED